jgi:hypothetical protein
MTFRLAAFVGWAMPTISIVGERQPSMAGGYMCSSSTRSLRRCAWHTLRNFQYWETILMWLPRDERRLLAFCYSANPNGSGSYSADDLKKLEAVVHLSQSNNLSKTPPTLQQTCQYIVIALRNRGLLTFVLNDAPGKMRIDLTPEGMVLGRKYNSKLAASGLWFAEYKDHWCWYVLSFLGGIIGALLVNWMRHPSPM